MIFCSAERNGAIGRGKTIYFIEDIMKLHPAAFGKRISGIAIGTAEIAGGQADENAGQARKRALALEA